MAFVDFRKMELADEIVKELQAGNDTTSSIDDKTLQYCVGKTLASIMDDDYYNYSSAEIRDAFKHLTRDEKLQFLRDYYLNKTVKILDEVLVYPITVKQSR